MTKKKYHVRNVGGEGSQAAIARWHTLNVKAKLEFWADTIRGQQRDTAGQWNWTWVAPRTTAAAAPAAVPKAPAAAPVSAARRPDPDSRATSSAVAVAALRPKAKAAPAPAMSPRMMAWERDMDRAFERWRALADDAGVKLHLISAGVDYVRDSQFREPVSSADWRVALPELIEAGEAVIPRDARPFTDKTGRDRWHLGFSPLVQAQLVSSRLFRRWWSETWAQVIGLIAGGSRRICVVFYCRAGRHRSVGTQQLMLSCASSITRW